MIKNYCPDYAKRAVVCLADGVLCMDRVNKNNK